jgi:hypothetical protein
VSKLLRNAVSLILLVPTTIICLLLSLLCLALAANGASGLKLMGIVATAWAVTISMWCIFLRVKDGAATQPMPNRKWYWLALVAALVLLGFAATDPGGGLFERSALGWLTVTVIYFCATLFFTSRKQEGRA